MRLTRTGRFSGAKLMDELLAAFPAWITVGMDGLNRVALRIETTADQVFLDVPDDTDTAAIDAVITAHDPDAVSPDVAAAQDRETGARAALDAFDAAFLEVTANYAGLTAAAKLVALHQAVVVCMRLLRFLARDRLR